MRTRLALWGLAVVLMLTVIFLLNRTDSGQGIQPEGAASQSQWASEEPEYIGERVASVGPSTVLARTNEQGQKIHGEPQLPVRPNTSELKIAELVAQLSHPDLHVRLAAGQALDRLGSNASPAVSMIGYLLASEPQKVHGIMLSILEDCVPEAQATIPALQNCLTSTNVALRMNSARTLWVLDNSQADAVRPVAEGCLVDPDPGARIEAASLLWSLDKDPQKVVPTLVALLNNRDKSYDYRTIKLLKVIGPGAKAAVPALEDWLASGRRKEAYVINTAVEALQSFRDPQ